MTTMPAARTARVTLLAAALAIAAEGVLTSGALLDMQLREGAIPAAIAALVTYVLPGVVVGVLVLATRYRRSSRPLGGTVLAGVTALVVARLATQVLDGVPRYVTGLATVAIAVATLLLAVVLVAAGSGDRSTGARDATTGLVLGLGLHAAVAAVTGTWGAVWRNDPVAWLVTLGLTALALWSAWQLRSADATESPRGAWVLGPFLGLVVLVLANPAFLVSQSQSGPHLAPVDGAAGALVAVVAIGTISLLHRDGGTTTAQRLALALPALIAAGYFLPGLLGSGMLVTVAILAAIPAAALLVLAMLRREPRPASRGRLVGLGVSIGLGAILPLLIFQIDYDIPLGFPNALAIVAAATLLVIGSRAWRAVPLAATPEPVAARRAPWRASLAAVRVPVAGLALVVVLGVWPAMPATSTETRMPGTEITVVSWNLHYGVTPEVSIDLEAVAQAIEAENPDVVALQEVSRGWLLGGGTDIAAWLSHRLQMGAVFAPAADRQFGNVLLSRYALLDVDVTPLPYGEGPQHRSAITAGVLLADGTPVRVSSIHIQHREANTPTRLLQLDTAIAEIAPTGPAILAGDLNAHPGWPEIDVLRDAGWVSAIDAAGDPDALTFPTWEPTERIDWVFGQHLDITRAEVMTDESSDHFGIVVTAVPSP